MSEKLGVTTAELVSYCNRLLQVDGFKDYCPNGLQVEGRADVKRIVSGVTACQALLDAAVEAQADMILVHHGYFWKGEAASITGIKRCRLATLLQNDINLLAYHLPLDAHPELGNNARLARVLGIEVQGGLEPGNPLSVGNIGRLAHPLALEDFASQLTRALGRQPQVIAAGDRPVNRVAWCTGAADRLIEQAHTLGADLYISGEISEPVVHLARELGIHYIAAGHHATERYGVQALGEHLSRHFGIEHGFIDIDNPV